MAKIFIEETTLTAIGDAIRGKEGSNDLVPVNDMASRITNLPSGGGGGGDITAEDLTFSGDGAYLFAGNFSGLLIDIYGNMITTKDITTVEYMFYCNKTVTEIPFIINIKDCKRFAYIFSNTYNLKVCPKIRGTINWTTAIEGLESMLLNMRSIRNLDDLFTLEMLEGFKEFKVTSSYTCNKTTRLGGCYSLRTIPTWWYSCRLNPESTAYPSTSYCLYYQTFEDCYALDEVIELPVWKCQAAQTSNMFSRSFNGCRRIKRITFETNPDGTPIEVQWKSQTIDLTNYVGYDSSTTYSIDYNSGITSDKEVRDDTTYQALKNDPDWFAIVPSYSRYDHDSAVETINTLPDTSAYLATAGGTNTIKFKGAAGSNTDGGAINTLTEEEIAIATAKGWTVTFA